MARFSTHLSLGQTAYGVQHSSAVDFYVGTLTVGQIRVTETDPRQRIWDTTPLFKEEYMCVETGVGSGTIWTYGKNIFATKEDAEAGVRAYEQAAHKERAERDALQEQNRIRREELDRLELSRLRAKYGEAA